MKEGRILLADDEELFLDSTAEILRREDYTCDVALNAASAMELIQENNYDVVIADIKMPGNSNLELVQFLEEQVPTLPVILVTGYPSVGTAVESVNFDVVAYLVKPVDIDDLLVQVRQAASKSRTYGLLQRIQERAQLQVQKLDQLEENIAAGDETPLLEAIFEAAFQNVADAYVDLKQLFSIMEKRQPEALAAGLRNDPDKQKMISTLEHAVQVLEETKRAFKSKQLAKLRKQLETVLDDVTA